MLQFRWALRRHPTQPGLIDLHVQEIAGDRGIVMSVTSRAEAREALPYLRGEVVRRIALVGRPVRTFDPSEDDEDEWALNGEV